MGKLRTMTDVVYEYMQTQDDSIEFNRLWEVVKTEMSISDSLVEKKIVQLYSDLMLDPRFTILKNNKWDLKSRHKFNDVHVNAQDIIIDDEDEDIYDEDYVMEKY